MKGRAASEIEALADDFVDDLVATMQPAVQVVLDEHRAAGHELVLISASPTEIVQRFAEASGMDYGRGTTAERDSDGRYSGRLEGPFCYKEGKAEVMRALAAQHGYNLDECFAYSDSVSDEPMMRAVGHPVAVNPDNALRTMALKGGWTILETGRLRAHFEPVRRAIRYASKTWAAWFSRIVTWRGRGQGDGAVKEQAARD